MIAVWLSMYGICKVLGWQMVAEVQEVLLQQLVKAIQAGILGVVHSTLLLASQAVSFVEPMQLLMRTATAFAPHVVWIAACLGICVLRIKAKDSCNQSTCVFVGRCQFGIRKHLNICDTKHV